MLNRTELSELFALNEEAESLAVEIANDHRKRMTHARRGAEIERRYKELVDRLPTDVRSQLPFDAEDPVLDARYVQSEERVVSLRLARTLDRLRTVRGN